MAALKKKRITRPRRFPEGRGKQFMAFKDVDRLRRHPARQCPIPRILRIRAIKEEEIRRWIVHTLKSGATIYQAKGAYEGTVRDEIITIVDKNEYQKLMQYISREDPTAFITVYNVSDMRYIPKNRPGGGKD